MLSVEKLNDELIELAFSEGIGDGDHTTLCCVPADAKGEGGLLIREEEVLAGVNAAKRVFHLFGSELQVEVYVEGGSHVKPGGIAMSVKGKTQSFLQTERLILNILQRMSGTATVTHKCQQALINTGTKTCALDTRKTTPGMRVLEKEAVKIGGGMSHCIGLFDMILLKNNHADFYGGVHNTISMAEQYYKDHGKDDLKIERKIRSFTGLGEASSEGCDRAMSDGFIPEDAQKTVGMVAEHCETGSSGGITFNTMIPYAQAGVDFISSGALTHSVKGLDVSFKTVVSKD